MGGSYRYLFRDADHAHALQHDHQHDHALGWAGLLLISLPIMLGLLVPPRPLGVAALQNREISAGALDSVLPAAVRSAQVKASGERTILDWVLAFHERQWPAETETADVVGFVYHDGIVDERQFTLTRFVVGCCAADAMAVGLPVSLGAESATGQLTAGGLEEGQWVRVVGRFAAPVGRCLAGACGRAAGGCAGTQPALSLSLSFVLIFCPHHLF